MQKVCFFGLPFSILGLCWCLFVCFEDLLFLNSSSVKFGYLHFSIEYSNYRILMDDVIRFLISFLARRRCHLSWPFLHHLPTGSPFHTNLFTQYLLSDVAILSFMWEVNDTLSLFLLLKVKYNLCKVARFWRQWVPDLLLVIFHNYFK